MQNLRQQQINFIASFKRFIFILDKKESTINVQCRLYFSFIMQEHYLFEIISKIKKNFKAHTTNI